VSGKAGGTLC